MYYLLVLLLERHRQKMYRRHTAHVCRKDLVESKKSPCQKYKRHFCVLLVEIYLCKSQYFATKGEYA